MRYILQGEEGGASVVVVPAPDFSKLQQEAGCSPAKAGFHQPVKEIHSSRAVFTVLSFKPCSQNRRGLKVNVKRLPVPAVPQALEFCSINQSNGLLESKTGRLLGQC